MQKRRKSKFFEQLTIVDTATKGKTVAKTLEGIPIFLSEGVPGDVVDIRTYKKRKGFLKEKLSVIIITQKLRTHPVCEHFDYVGAVNGNICSIQPNWNLKKKRC